MEAIMFYLLSGVVTYFVYLSGWIAATVMLAVMVIRGAGKVERFLLIGSCLMLAGSLLNVPSGAIRTMLAERGYGMLVTATLIPILSGLNLLGVLTGLAGIITIVYAIWIKFKANHGT